MAVYIIYNSPRKNNTMFIAKWIEGEKLLHSFCISRFHEAPRFVETIGRVGGEAKVYLTYKWRRDTKRYVPMYLLFMEHPNGTVSDINEIRLMKYEQIRTYRGSLLVP